jgi:hypothetical protein
VRVAPQPDSGKTAPTEFSLDNDEITSIGGTKADEDQGGFLPLSGNVERAMIYGLKGNVTIGQIKL